MTTFPLSGRHRRLFFRFLETHCWRQRPFMSFFEIAACGAVLAQQIGRFWLLFTGLSIPCPSRFFRKHRLDCSPLWVELFMKAVMHFYQFIWSVIFFEIFWRHCLRETRLRSAFCRRSIWMSIRPSQLPDDCTYFFFPAKTLFTYNDLLSHIAKLCKPVRRTLFSKQIQCLTLEEMCQMCFPPTYPNLCCIFKRFAITNNAHNFRFSETP